MSPPNVTLGQGVATGGFAQIIIREFIIDVSITEDHTFDSEVTEFPVESGSTISDNIRPKPITITVEGLVSNTPIGQTRVARINTHHVLDAAGNDTGRGVVGSPAQEGYALLLEVRDNREPVVVATSLDVFENMVMTHLSIPRSAGSAAALRFTATFQQIEIVQNKRVRVRTAIRAGGKGNRGTVPTIPIPASVITWHHGQPPGGFAILYTTQVLYTNHHFYHLPNGSVPVAILAGKNIGGDATQAANPGIANPSTPDADLTKLDAQELQDFSADNARDTAARTTKFPTRVDPKPPKLTPDQLNGGDSRTIAKGRPMIPASSVSKNPNAPAPKKTPPRVNVGKVTGH